MQSSTAATSSFKVGFTLDKPNRHIDKVNQTKTMYKKVIVLAEQDVNLTEYSGLFQQLGFKVYDDAEALRRDHRQYWLEAAQAKESGKPYDYGDWNKLLGEYDAIVAHIARPFAKELTDHRNISSYYTSVIAVTKATTITLSDSRLLFPFVTGREQKFIEISSYDAKVICEFLGIATPSSPFKATESAEPFRMSYLSDCIDIHYIFSLNKMLIAFALALAALSMGYFFTPLASLAIPTIIAGHFGLEMAANSFIKSDKAFPYANAPHIKNGYKMAARPAAPAAQVTKIAATTNPVTPCPKNSSSPHSKRFTSRGSNSRKYSKYSKSFAPTPQPKDKRTPISAPGWDNVIEAIKASDEKAKVEQEAKKIEMEGKLPGVWKERYGSRYCKAVAADKSGRE